jgi:hypothetical protein
MVYEDPDQQTDSNAIEGLPVNAPLYVIVRGSDRISLARTLQDALAGNALDLTALGTGTNHALQFEQLQRLDLSPTATVLPAEVRSQLASTSVAEYQLSLADADIQAGDQLVLRFTNLSAGTDPIVLTYDVPAEAASEAAVTMALRALIEAEPGLLQGSTEEVGSDAYLSLEEGGESQLRFKAQQPATNFTLVAEQRRGDALLPNTLRLVQELQSYKPKDAAVGLELRFAGDTPAPDGQLVELSDGVLQAADGSLIGVEAFLQADQRLVNAAGETLAADRLVAMASLGRIYSEANGDASHWQARFSSQPFVDADHTGPITTRFAMPQKIVLATNIVLNRYE